MNRGYITYIKIFMEFQYFINLFNANGVDVSVSNILSIYLSIRKIFWLEQRDLGLSDGLGQTSE